MQLNALGWQYIGFWRDAEGKLGVRHLILGRRQFEQGVWDELVFTDHDQVVDDGHNVGRPME